MQSISIIPDNRNHWLQLKSEDISSTEVSALFDMCPYLTKFELFHIKQQKQIIEIEDNERMKWGRRLEDVIAHGFAEDYGLVVKKKPEYMRHGAVPRMSASFDYEIVGINPVISQPLSKYNLYQQTFLTEGHGLLEIKKVDGFIYRDQWYEQEAPAHIEFQIQQQMEVSNCNWGIIAPLVGGNEIKPILRMRDKNMGIGLVKAISDFGQQMAANLPPKPDYAKDAETIINLYNKSGVEVLFVDPTHKICEEITNLCAQHKAYSLAFAEAEDMKKIIKAKILEIAKAAGKIITPEWSINLGEVKGSEGTLITADMVGTYVGARNGYRMCRITENKGKK